MADFTLKASIETNLWMVYEVNSRLENLTPAESFFRQLRSEIEGLHDDED